MAITNQERVGKAMDLLRQGLAPFVEREVQQGVKAGTVRMDTIRRFADDPRLSQKPIVEWDAAGLLKLMWETWNEVFRTILGPAERGFVGELRGVPQQVGAPGAVLWRRRGSRPGSMTRLLTAVSAPQADDVNKMKLELRRLIFDEQVRGEKRKAGGSLIETGRRGSLKPWREVVTPHADVASGRYQQAEFAADLWQVHLGEGSDEYRKPAEFFRRTFLTESLKRLLVGGVQRIAGTGGDPVVQLQTNFGGGKTHSMLALYHLFSGVSPSDLAGVDAVLAEAGVKSLPTARRVVLVGNKISPGNPVTKADGTVVRTLWGELAYQLGGQEGVRPHREGRREGDQSRRRAARAVRRVRPVPGADRRVGRLRPAASRPERSAGRRLRDAVHLRPGAHRVGEAREELPARRSRCRPRTPEARRTRRLTMWRWAASAAARRSTASGTWSAASSRRGGRRPPRRASRSSGGGCSSRSAAPTRSSSAT